MNVRGTRSRDAERDEAISNAKASHGKRDNDAHPVNAAITAANVRLVDAAGVNRGIVPLAQARAVAASSGMDLVQMAAGDVPVCRVLEYSKFKYEQQKKERDAARAARAAADVHQVKLRPMIDEHDYHTKISAMRKFLDRGDRVKVTVTFKGRLITHPELGTRLLERLAADLADVARMSDPGRNGRDMTVMLTPLAAHPPRRP